MLFAAFSDVSQLLGLLGCATMKVSSSANQMAAVSHQPGNVMAIQIVKMAVTNITPALLAPVPPRCSVVTTGTVCYAAGFATETTTAGTWAMKETVPRRLSDVPAGSGSAPATVCASTSPLCVTTLLTAPMVLTSLLSAVSLISAFLLSLQQALGLSERFDCFITFRCLQAFSNSILFWYHMMTEDQTLTWFDFIWHSSTTGIL